jgi:hypothetical protein
MAFLLWHIMKCNNIKHMEQQKGMQLMLLITLAWALYARTVMLLVFQQHRQLCMAALLAVVVAWQGSGRLWYRYPRNAGLWHLLSDDAVPVTVKDEVLYHACRMHLALFGQLCDMLAPYLPLGPQAVPVRQAVAAVLYRLAHNASVWEVAQAFGLGCSTVVLLTHRICDALVQQYGPVLLYIPDDVQTCMGEFAALCGLPNVVGALDGKIFRLDRAPSRSPYLIIQNLT